MALFSAIMAAQAAKSSENTKTSRESAKAAEAEPAPATAKERKEKKEVFEVNDETPAIDALNLIKQLIMDGKIKRSWSDDRTEMLFTDTKADDHHLYRLIKCFRRLGGTWHKEMLAWGIPTEYIKNPELAVPSKSVKRLVAEARKARKGYYSKPAADASAPTDTFTREQLIRAMRIINKNMSDKLCELVISAL